MRLTVMVLSISSFWSYELSKSLLGLESETMTTLVAGGIAGCVTWASIYPLDVIKTRVQTQQLQSELIPNASLHRPLLRSANGLSAEAASRAGTIYAGAWEHAKIIYRTEGFRGYFSGFWWCMGRSFFVNAIQWTIYEQIIKILAPPSTSIDTDTLSEQARYG